MNLIENSRPKQYYVMGGNFKFQVQDSFLEYFFFEIWRSKKRISLSGKKPPLLILPFFSIRPKETFYTKLILMVNQDELSSSSLSVLTIKCLTLDQQMALLYLPI